MQKSNKPKKNFPSVETVNNQTIIAFVNPTAGGGQGVKVLQDLQNVIGIENCFDLKQDKGPAKGLNLHRNTKNLVVIAGGGDGTVGWVLTVIETIEFDEEPTVVPLALGTANDMSRILKWGKGYAGEDLKQFVNKIKYQAEIVELDRWKVTLVPITKEKCEEYKLRQQKLVFDSDDDDSDDKDDKDRDDRDDIVSEKLIKSEKKHVREMSKDIKLDDTCQTVKRKKQHKKESSESPSDEKITKLGDNLACEKAPRTSPEKQPREKSYDESAPARPKMAAPLKHEHKITTELSDSPSDEKITKLGDNLACEKIPEKQPREKPHDETVNIQSKIIATDESTVPARPKLASPVDKPKVIEMVTSNPKNYEGTLKILTEPDESTVPARPKLASPVDKPKTLETTQKKVPKNEKEISNTTTFIANNYFSIGLDSKMLLDFDTLRTKHPEYFVHRMVNFGWYGIIGIKSMIENYQSLRHFTTLNVDEKEQSIPKKVKAIVCMNVPSYSGGTNPWKVSRNANNVPEITPQSICDSTLEIFAMEGAAHFGRNIASVSRGGIRITQGKNIKFIITEQVAGQVDGEPYLFFPSKIKVSLYKKSKMLFCTANDPYKKKRDKLLGKSKI